MCFLLQKHIKLDYPVRAQHKKEQRCQQDNGKIKHHSACVFCPEFNSFRLLPSRFLFKLRDQFHLILLKSAA